ncbi:MAG: hemolysin activation/secretion protein [Cellvibrionaceae bacterium]|jgi:hemolysin activation/secretion protein
MCIKNTFYLFIAVVVATVFYCSSAAAGFLDMPEIIEAPELERKSLLRDLDIPNVRERDPDPNAGPRLDVREFRVQGLVEYPKLGITREEIIKRVEAIRFELMSEGERLESGYTLEELGEISDLIAEIEEETKDEHVGAVEVQRLVFLIRDQRRERGLTLGMVETVADTITNYYRERGFVLAKAYIPKQRVRDGVVNLTLLLGTLGEVAVSNNRHYSEGKLQSVFDSMMGEPVTNALIEERLFLINDFPGLNVQGYFEPGAQVGDTKLNINVFSEDRFDGNLRIDNHGADQTGENRLYGDLIWNNPTGFGDQLYLAGLYASDPGSTTYGAIRYSINVFSPQLLFAIGASNNAFVVGENNLEGGGGDLALVGESEVVDSSLTWKLKRSRTRNFSLGLKYEDITSTTESGTFPSLPIPSDDVQNTSLAFNFDVLNERKRRLHQGSFRVISGEITDPESFAANTSYSIFAYDYTLLTFWRVPFTDAESRLITRFSGQIAGESLPAVSQFALAGPTRARGFAVNDFSADDAIYLGVDWVFDSPEFLSFSSGKRRYTDVVQPFLFADYSIGEVQSGTTGLADDDAEYANIGLGFKLSLFDNFRGNLQFAFPVKSELSTGSGDDDGAKLYFDLQYSFD